MKWPLSTLSAATILCVAAFVAGQTAAQNARNVSLDDQDARITYSPSRSSWTLTEPGEWDAGDGKAHMLSDDPEARASFKFTGVALHYWAARWPYAVLTTLAIDGLEFPINLTDPNPAPGSGLPPSQKSSVVFSATDLDNTEHDVTVSVGRGTTGNFAIVDFFTFTELETETSITGASTTASTTASTRSTATQSDVTSTPTDEPQTGASSKGLSTALKISIAVAIIGVFGLLLVLFFLLRWLKKRKQEQRQSEKSAMLGGYLSPNTAQSASSSLMMNHPRSPTPTPLNPMWNDPDYVEAAKRMNVPVSPYQQPISSRSSVRLVVPEDDPRPYSDGSDYPTMGTISPPPDQPIHIPYHPYASSQPYTSSYGYASQSYGR